MKYDYQTADPALYPLLKDFAKHNRSNPTEAESLLWNYLKTNEWGVTFKRQHIIGRYIADFFCIERKLVIELDGGYHQLPEQQDSDEQRTAWLTNHNFKVIRFTNQELFNDISHVLYIIENNLYE